MVAVSSIADPFLFKEYLAGPRFGNRNLSGKTLVSSILTAPVKTIIIGGQSNMCTCIGSSTYTVVSDKALNLNIYDGGIYAGSDPVLGCSIGGAAFSSVCMPLADSVISRGKATTCVVVPIGIDGIEYAIWRPTATDSMYGRLVTAILRCRARGLEPDAIIWGQGETDAFLGTSSTSVRDSIWAMVDGIRAAPISCAAPFYAGQYTMSSGATDATVRTGIANAVDVGRNIVLGYDADTNLTVAGGFRLGDQTHLSNTGRDAAALGWSTIAFP